MPKLILPECPAHEKAAVSAWRKPVTISTYGLREPDRNPMFLERRVYQGSSGKVYPLPFYNRVNETPHDQSWDAIHIENKYIRVMILPQIGGRIHIAMDKTNGYDFIYRQDVIKPALVGLAGPWISGGIEFNWPQHHRPGTYMPCDAHIESHDDGSKTVWLSEHDPMNRLKGMHGVCLHPDKSYLELKARLYNRTELTQTFLWWANVATRVHEKYQSFFPPDVCYVADHAKRAMSRFPLCDDRYYGVNYGERGRRGELLPEEMPRQFIPPPGMYAPNDLSWYANIPVPTSYMCMGSSEDFVGGYDHAAEAGIIHVADHHISPGKKQWTWGNHEFGYAWDRNLTDSDENGVYHPYIELMAGVFTDNQPDFSFLAAGETRTFSQFWYPIQKIGPAQKANVDAAISLRANDGQIRIGVGVTCEQPDARIALAHKDTIVKEWRVSLAPASPFVDSIAANDVEATDFALTVLDRDGRELIAYHPIGRPHATAPGEGEAPAEPLSRQTAGSAGASPSRLATNDVPPPATEIPPPEEIQSIDELYVSGLHLEQYRHATRRPEMYWREALRRDPLDSRCNNAMGLWHLRRGAFADAETHFRSAIERLTKRNPNPRDGESFYNLGLALRHQDRDDEAYEAFYKATWNRAWQAPAHFALAELDCRRSRWPIALEHLDRVLRMDADHLQARDLKAIVLRELGRESEAMDLLHDTLTLDPLDWSARFLRGETLSCDTQVRLDLSMDYARAGLWALAVAVLKDAAPEPRSGTAPLVHYYLAFFDDRQHQIDHARAAQRSGAGADPAYCFPARLDEIAILKRAIAADPTDARAPYYLGNLLYDRQRYQDAIDAWEMSVSRDASFATVHRNLGIAYFNVLDDPAHASDAYAKACICDPRDARLLYERDQLRKRTGEPPRVRLAALIEHMDLVRPRDDLTIELCALFNQTGEHDRALELLSSRRFQPWEGGEGLALAQYVRTHLSLGRCALQANKPSVAREHFDAAAHPPENLGETKHLLANQSDIHYWLGVASEALGDRAAARHHWTIAASASGDFLEMSVRPFSEMSYYSGLSLARLGRESEGQSLLKGLLDYAESLAQQPARIDYFATSLPTLLLFNDDLDQRQKIYARLLKAQALLGLDHLQTATALLQEVLAQDPNHPTAHDLLQART